MNLNFFESGTKPTLHVGRRMIKTVIAVFLCALIGYARGTDSAILSMVAAILCIQPTKDESIIVAINRIIGTVLGGALGAICLYVSGVTGLIEMKLFYHLVVALMLVPIIQLTLLMRKPSLSSFTCIVFLIITVTMTEGANAIDYSLTQTLESIVGIVVGLCVNWFFPNSKKNKESGLDNSETVSETSAPEAEAEPETAPTGDELLPDDRKDDEEEKL